MKNLGKVRKIVTYRPLRNINYNEGMCGDVIYQS